MKLTKSTCFLLLLSLIFSAVFVPCAFNASAQSPLQSYIDEQIEEHDFHGVVYATRNGEVVCEAARGMANTAEGKEMTTDTMFPIGSLSKQFCATAVLLLQEQGKLSVDDKLSEYFPEYTVAKDVTVKNLLTNRSGIINHLIGLYEYEYTLSADATQEENEQTILEWFYTKELAFKPDARYEYSNGNFFLLSLIVEQASGQNYSDFVKENILIPLEMNNSGFYEELYNHPDLAEHKSEPTDIPFDYELKGLAQGAGDLVSNAKDMYKWMTSLREHTILSEESYKEMTTDYSPTVGYGYGIGVLPNGSLSHTGAAISYVCTATTYPEKGINIFAITNDLENEEDALFTIAYGLEDKLIMTYGDVTGDNTVNVKDATLIQKFAAKFFKLNDTETLCADVNTDEKVNIKDATAIQKYVAKIETNLPIGNYIY